MTNSDAILLEARQRGNEGQFAYAGAVTPQEAYALISNNTGFRLIDVRTQAERDWVGIVNIPAGQHLSIQWSLYPGGTPNPDFEQMLTFQVTDKDTVLLFLCRSGVRSRSAAKKATELGYTQCFDILQGFEGNKDAQAHRKTVDGWCKADLPWIGA